MQKGLQEVPPMPRQQHTLPWNYDEELSTLINNRITLRKQANTADNLNSMKELNKKIRSKVKRIRNQLLKTNAKHINEAKEQRKIAKQWKMAKQHDKDIFRKPKPIQCPGLSSFFKEHFNPDQSSLTVPSEIQHLPSYIEALRESNSAINQEPPNQQEILIAVKELNTGKATIDIEAEIVKCAETVPQSKTFWKNITGKYGQTLKYLSNGDYLE